MSTENEYKQAVADLTKATDQVKNFADTARTELKNLGEVTKETKASADKALTEMNALAARMTELEQKGARGNAPEGQNAGLSLGQRLLQSDEVKAAMSRGPQWKGTAQVEVKNITSASSTGTSASTGLVVADRQSMIMLPDRQLVIRDLLAPGSTSSGAIEYPVEKVFTNAANFVAENPSVGAPQSEITFGLNTLPVRAIAHFVLASKEVLADAPQLQSIIDGRLREGLALKEDDQFLNGNGQDQNILGLMAQSVAYAAPAGVSVKNETMIDRLRLAMLQATLAGFPATGHILHPTDWTSITLTKDGESRYVFANPQGVSGAVLWGLPVAQSLSMAAGKFMVGAFRYAAQIFDREDATVTISTEDGDNVRKRMVTIMAEERTCLAVYRPQALVNGSFADLTAAPAGG